MWRDWYTHDIVEYTSGAAVTLPAPLGHINVHVRDGSAILLHATPAYTIEETRQGPYSLLISQSADGWAFGSAYIDDGVSYPTPSRSLTFSATRSQVVIASDGSFDVKQRLREITVLGVSSQPTLVLVDGKRVAEWSYVSSKGKLVAQALNIDLNNRVIFEWQ
jgi:alpha-glucosidase